MKEKILFVDDDPELLQGLQRMLRSKRNEWDMTFVSGGKQALDAMKVLCYDVVVADMRMPEINGAELLNQVKRICKKSVRIILSGQADLPTILSAISSTHQYLSKPCDPDTLKETIERATHLQKLMKNEQLDEFISQLERLPSVPELYDQVVAELKSEKPSLEKISELIGRDVGMAVKVLQLVNSSFFGPKREVFSIYEAVGILGIDLLRSLVLSHHIFLRSDTGFIGTLELSELCKHSISVGNYAQRLAIVEGVEQMVAERCSTIGLLHDIGKVVMALYSPEKYSHVLAPPNLKDQGLSKETTLYGTTHCEVGAYLLGLWGLPGTVVDAASYHYGKESTEFSLLTALQVADALASATHPLGSARLESFLEVGGYKKFLHKDPASTSSPKT